MKERFFLGVLVFLFFGCASSRIEKSDFRMMNPVYITNSKRFSLLPPECIANPRNAQQFLSGSYGEKEFSFLCYLDADKNGIFLSLYNAFGTGMGNLSYDGKSVFFDSAVFPKNAKAEYIVADLQFAYYSAESLSSALKNAGLILLTEMQESAGIKKEVRKIMDGKKCVAEIEISEKSVIFRNFLRKYSYNLEEVTE